MRHRDRLYFYGIGFAMGCVILMIVASFKERAHETRNEGRNEATYIANINASPAPLEGSYIIDEHTDMLPPHPDHKAARFLRTLVFESKTPGDFIRLHEFTTIDPESNQSLVYEREWSYADRLLVTLKPNVSTKTLSDEIRPEGYRLRKPGDAPNTVLVSLPTHEPLAVSQGIKRLTALEEIVVKAEPIPYTGL